MVKHMEQFHWDERRPEPPERAVLVGQMLVQGFLAGVVGTAVVVPFVLGDRLGVEDWVVLIIVGGIWAGGVWLWLQIGYVRDLVAWQQRYVEALHRHVNWLEQKKPRGAWGDVTGSGGAIG